MGECFSTGCKITYGSFPHSILPEPKHVTCWHDLPADELLPQVTCETRYFSSVSSFTSLLQCCRIMEPNWICRRSKSRWNDKSRINTGRWNRSRPNKSPGNRRTPLADWPRLMRQVESRELFRNWEVGRSWRWQAWLALWPLDPENREDKKRQRENEFNVLHTSTRFSVPLDNWEWT